MKDHKPIKNQQYAGHAGEILLLRRLIEFRECASRNGHIRGDLHGLRSV